MVDFTNFTSLFEIKGADSSLMLGGQALNNREKGGCVIYLVQLSTHPVTAPLEIIVLEEK